MEAQDYLRFLRQIKTAAFATVDERGLPQVRMIDVMLIAPDKLYFCTARGKAFYRQLMANGQIAVTSMNEHFQMVRLSGKAVHLREQKKWLHRIFEENPSMNRIYPGNSRYILEPFCIQEGQISFFDLSTEPIMRESLSFGKKRRTDNGFIITDSCIGCGACKVNCPQQCVKKGTPYKIQSCHCLHCGLCAELCPVQAIKRKEV